MATTARARKTATKPAATAATEPAAGTRKPAATKTNGKPVAQPKVAEKDADAPTPEGLKILNANVERAAKAKVTREESKASNETRKCAGECGDTKPINKFPTTTRNKDGEMGRGTVCRACRDKARADAKAGK